MKCLSLWQPWATLIAIGAKRIETRHWSTDHRGPILIHAAKKWNLDLGCMCAQIPFIDHLTAIGYYPGPTKGWGLPFGAIIAVVDLWDCVPTSSLNAAGIRVNEPERSFGDFSDGRWGWMTRDLRRFPDPIPFKGHQQLFNVPDELVADQLAKAAPGTADLPIGRQVPA